jgi:hypothetical protein
MRYLAAVAALAGCVLVAACAGKGSADPPHSASSTSRAASDPAPSKLLSGSSVTSKIHWHGRTLAAGAMFGTAALKAGPRCTNGCNPVVWVSDGSLWRAVLEVPAQGSIAGEQLLAGPFGVLLFNSDEHLALWRSTNARTWVAQPLPAAMANGFLTSASVNGHEADVGVVSKYGSSSVTWTSTDGRHWHR